MSVINPPINSPIKQVTGSVFNGIFGDNTGGGAPPPPLVTYNFLHQLTKGSVTQAILLQNGDFLSIQH